MSVEVSEGRRKPGPVKLFEDQIDVHLTGAQLEALRREGERQGMSRAALIRAAINRCYLPDVVR